MQEDMDGDMDWRTKRILRLAVSRIKEMGQADIELRLMILTRQTGDLNGHVFRAKISEDSVGYMEYARTSLANLIAQCLILAEIQEWNPQVLLEEGLLRLNIWKELEFPKSAEQRHDD